MDLEYREIFSMLYSPFTSRYSTTRWLSRILSERFTRGPEASAVRQAIDEAEEKLLSAKGQGGIRADAKYFLLINLMQMVVVPARVRGSIGLEELRRLLSSDVAFLVNEAARQAEGREISGHVILETVATRWRQLQLSNFRIWGEE